MDPGRFRYHPCGGGVDLPADDWPPVGRHSAGRIRNLRRGCREIFGPCSRAHSGFNHAGLAAGGFDAGALLAGGQILHGAKSKIPAMARGA